MSPQPQPTSPHPTPAEPTGSGAGSAAPANAAVGPGTGPGGRLARMTVVLCFVITAVAMALIYWRWANVAEPTSYIIVQGNEDLDGTIVTVSTFRGGDVVAMATLEPKNDYVVTIFLHPGSYWFSATQKDTKLKEGEMVVAGRRWWTIPLARPKPGNGEAASGSRRDTRRARRIS